MINVNNRTLKTDILLFLTFIPLVFSAIIGYTLGFNHEFNYQIRDVLCTKDDEVRE